MNGVKKVAVMLALWKRASQLSFTTFNPNPLRTLQQSESICNFTSAASSTYLICDIPRTELPHDAMDNFAPLFSSFCIIFLTLFSGQAWTYPSSSVICYLLLFIAWGRFSLSLWTGIYGLALRHAMRMQLFVFFLLRQLRDWEWRLSDMF